MVRISLVCRKLNSPRYSVGAPRRWKRAFSVRNPLSQGQSQVSRLSMFLNAECPWTRISSGLSHVQTRHPIPIARRIKVRNRPPLLNPPDRDSKHSTRTAPDTGSLVPGTAWERGCCSLDSMLQAIANSLHLSDIKIIGSVCFMVFVFGHLLAVLWLLQSKLDGSRWLG